MTETHDPKEGSIPFYPDHVKTEFKVVLVIVFIAVLVGIYGLLHPVGLEAPADPMNTPLHVKPEWYFLDLYVLLRYIPKTVGVFIPIVLMALLVVWPFLDVAREKSYTPTKVRAILITIAFIVMIALTIWGNAS